MAVRSTASPLTKLFVLAALLAGGVAAHQVILAQAGLEPAHVVITPIPKPVTDTGIALARADAGAVTTPSAPGAWGGPRSGAQATLSDRVVDYRIAATLDPVAHTVDGRQVLTWRNRSSETVRSVYVHLYMNAFQNGASTFFTEQRNGNAGFRSGVDTGQGEWGYIDLKRVVQGGAKVNWAFVQPDNGPPTDRTVARLDLPAPVAPGASTSLEIDFLTQLPRVVARTGYFGSFHLVAQWFPKIAVLELAGERGATAPRWNAHEFHQQSEFYADFGNFDVRLTVPSEYTVGATGALQGAPSAKGGWTTHHYAQGDVHDFAWTADKRSAAPLRATWSGPGSVQVALTVLYPPEMEAAAKTALKAAQDSLTYFSTKLGPYPYRTLTVVVPPHNAEEAGGMEYPTFFTTTGATSAAPGSANGFEVEFTTIHEFGHGYFYGILASNEVEEPLLDEGLNEYWNQRMLRERKQAIHLAPPFLQALGFDPAFQGFDMERAGTPREEPADAAGQNAWLRLQGIGPAYTRGATLMRDLEARIGSEAMERAFKEYYKRWKFRHPSIADLRETLAEASGQRAQVEAVFAQQVYATAKIDDRVDTLRSEEVLPQAGMRQEGGKWIEETADQVDARIEQVRSAWDKANPDAADGKGPFPFRTSVTLRRRGAPVPQTVLWDDSARWQRFEWTRPSKAVSVELDPQRHHYLDTSKLDDSRTLKANGAASRRWAGDFSAIVAFLLSLIAVV